MFTWGEDGGGGKGEGLSGVSEALRGVAVGLDILGRCADVGPEGAGHKNAGDLVLLFLCAPVGGDDGFVSFFGNEGENIGVEKLEPAEGGVSVFGIVEASDESLFASDGSGTGVFGEPAGGEGLLLCFGAEKGSGPRTGATV